MTRTWNNDELTSEWGESARSQLRGLEADHAAVGTSLTAHEASSEHGQLYNSIYSGVTYKRGIVALRFDDSHSNDQSVLKPLLDARYLPAGFAAIKGRLDGVGNVTTAQLLQMQADGHEIMSHTRTHTDPALQPNPASFFVDEVETVGTELRAAGCLIQSWVQPGTWTGGWFFDTSAKMTASLAGQGRSINELLKQNYGAAEAYIADDNPSGSTWPLPSRYLFGVQHTGIDAMTSTGTMTALIDTAIKYGGLVEILFHSFNLDQAGQPTTVQVTAFLDYLQARRDAGVVDVLTPTAARYAVQSDYKVNLLVDPSFEETAIGAVPAATGLTSQGWAIAAGAPTIITGVDRNNSGRVAKITQTDTVVQQFSANATRSIRVDAFMRATAAAGTGTGRIQIQGFQAGNGTPIVNKSVTGALTTTYSQITGLVGRTPLVDYWAITLNLTGGAGAYVSSVSAVKT